MNENQKRIFMFAGACVVLTVVAVLSLFSWSTNYNYCVSNNGSHYSGQYNNHDEPILVPAFADKLGTFRLFIHCGGVFTEQHSGAITAAATILLLFVTGILGWIAFRQYTTTRAQLRAYVIQDSSNLVDGSRFEGKTFVDRSGQPGVVLVVKNHGQTPAFRVHHLARMSVGPISEEGRMFVDTTDMPAVGGAVLAPDGNMTANRWLGRPLTQQESDGIGKGVYAIFCYGRIEYFDVWGRKFWSTYRLRYSESAWPPIGDGIGMDFCRSGNDAT